MEIEVGPVPAKFKLLKELIRNSSKVFEAALRGGWPEYRENKVKLPTHDPVIFNVYANWLHRGLLFVDQEEDQLIGDSHCLSGTGHMLVRIYELGQFILDNDFQDAVMDALVHTYVRPGESDRLPNIETIWLAYGSTPSKDSKLRKFFVTLYKSLGATVDGLRGTGDEYPDEFLEELAEPGLKGYTVIQHLFEAAFCMYHKHPGGARNCYKTKAALEKVVRWSSAEWQGWW